jgi:hypothetical protein
MDEFHIKCYIYADYPFPISKIKGNGKVKEGRGVIVNYRVKDKGGDCYQLLGISNCRFDD